MMRRWLLLAALAASGCALFTPPNDCADGRVNGEETDLDCGGAVCGGCAEGRLCLVDRDCASQTCTANRCAPPSCTDGVTNGTETDVDCGGGCPGCEVGQACLTPGDCLSGACRRNLCAAPSCTNDARDGDETDVDCGGSCGPCSAGKACRVTADCGVGECLDGACGERCGAPLLECAEGCVDPRVDPLHCGACATPCPAGVPCVGGMCRLACFGGTLQCGLACVDLGSNPSHCGACNRPCPSGAICVGGSCLAPCPPTQQLCAGRCVSPDRDAQHCGGCGNACPAGSSCVGGQCLGACAQPLLVCDNGTRCVDPRTDPDACGDCLTACPAPPNALPLCVQGQCDGGACLPGFDDCNGLPADGCEAELGLNSNHCGSCGRACSLTETCDFGRCCGPLPGGSYINSCFGCEACDDLLSCLCEDVTQTLRPTAIPISPCAGSFSNCNGVLTCDGC